MTGGPHVSSSGRGVVAKPEYVLRAGCEYAGAACLEACAGGL